MFILIDAEDIGFSEPPNVEIGFSRFIAAMVMHIVSNDEIYNGMKMMKYSVNHPWKFSNPQMAFTSGFLQVFSMALISVINYLVINQSTKVIDIAKDFTALMIIADFDDIFGGGMDQEKAKTVCLDEEGIYKKIFTIETTTSKDAEGERDERICKDAGLCKVIKDVNLYRRLRNVSKIYKSDGSW